MDKFKEAMIELWEQDRGPDNLETIPQLKNMSEIDITEILKIPRLTKLSDELYNKNILVLGELGYGDCIWLYRYVKELSKYVKSLTFVVGEPLVPLFKEDLENSNILNVVTLNEIPKIKFDTFSWSFDLPVLFKFNLFSEKYIHVNSENIIENSIGICLGNTDMDEGSWYRNCPMEYADMLTKGYKKIYNFSMQESEFINIRNKVCTFLDTAKYLMKMSLFITTDNVMLNLAGALGIPTIALFNSTCRDEWIWHNIKDTSTGWYNKVQPFICKDYNSWEEVIKRVLDSEYYKKRGENYEN